MMKIDLKSAGLGLIGGLAITAAAAQATQAQDHQHQTPAPQAGQPKQGMGHDRMQGMDHGRMMTDPAMRRQMMERMRQCHEMMSQMMAHMEHSGQAEHPQPQPQPQ